MPKKILGVGRYVRMVEDNGWEYVERVGISGIVGIVPLTDDGELVLVEQFRQPVAAGVIELPAGLAGDLPGQEKEPLLAAAKRELFEETGYHAGHWRHLIDGPPSPGVCSEIVHWFLATGLEKEGPGGGDLHEQITTHHLAPQQALTWLARKRKAGCFIDSKVFLGLYFAERELGG